MVKNWLITGKTIFFLKKILRIKTEYDNQTGICLLTIPQMFNEDLGEYTCKATNNIGVNTSSAHVNKIIFKN